MKKKHNNKRKFYYIGLLKPSEDIIVAPTMSLIADFIGISTKTISRHLKDTSKYTTDEYLIWKDITPVILKRGFALK